MSNRSDNETPPSSKSSGRLPFRNHGSPSSGSANYQQNALRRLTSRRSAASIVSVNDGRSVSRAAASASSVAEEDGSSFRGPSPAPSSFSHSDTNEPSRHQYTSTQRPNNNQMQQQIYTLQNPIVTNDSAPRKEGWVVVAPTPLSPSLPPCQRSLHAAAVVKDSLYVFGGYDGQNRVNDFYQYHFPTGCWREIVTAGNNTLVAGTHNQEFGQGGNADMGGGANHNGNNNAPNHGEMPQQPVSQRVSIGVGNIAATGTVPTPRDRHVAVVHDSTFYIFGGFDGTSRVSDLYGFDVDRLVWREVRPNVPNTNPRLNGAAVGQADGERRVRLNIVDAGGGGRSAALNNNNQNNAPAWQNLGGHPHEMNRGGRESDGIEEQDFPPRQEEPPQQHQQQVGGRRSHPPPSPRHSHSAIVYNDSMFVFGGYDGSYRSDFHEFDFVHCSWRPVLANGRTPRARYRATACVHEDMMILFGGHDGTRHLSDVHTFDFLTQSWSLLMTDGVPPLPRDSHVSVVYKHSMYVFGGSTGSAMNDLHELTFPSSCEENMTTDTVAVPDYSTYAGSAATFQDEGGETISIAKWRQIPPVPGGGIAVHRFCHVGAVYNGSFYVFGGYDGSSRLSDLVKYDLALDDLFETAVPPSTLLTDLQSFLHDDGCLSVSDITIMVENVPVRAHKIMLMRCPYFRAMLLSEMSERCQSVITIELVSHPIFLSVLEYLYTDQEPHIPLESVMELFVAADLFGIPRLQTMCERLLLESISVENAATIFYAADIHSATSLRNKALGYVLSHFEAVSKTSSFEDMARCNVELVFEILKSR